MDIEEERIGVWPNLALVPGTHIHAATGEVVEQPEWSRVGKERKPTMAEICGINDDDDGR